MKFVRSVYGLLLVGGCLFGSGVLSTGAAYANPMAMMDGGWRSPRQSDCPLRFSTFGAQTLQFDRTGRKSFHQAFRVKSVRGNVIDAVLIEDDSAIGQLAKYSVWTFEVTQDKIYMWTLIPSLEDGKLRATRGGENIFTRCS